MAGWVKTPLGTEVDLGPGHIVLDGIPAPAKGAQQPPSFRPMTIVVTVAHLSYTAELLYKWSPGKTAETIDLPLGVVVVESGGPKEAQLKYNRYSQVAPMCTS